MTTPENGSHKPPRRWANLMQRRVSVEVDQVRPQRWNWYALVRPLDHSLARLAPDAEFPSLRNLRYFWVDGLVSSISEHFYLGFIALFALAYGATNSQLGLLAAVANLMGALALFPGASLVERSGRRKPVVVWSGGVFARLALLGLAFIPFFIADPMLAILAIILFDGLRALMSNLANPGWTSLVADLVPENIRGRFFSSRNTAMGIAALLISPLAGRIIIGVNERLDSPFAGYQASFFLAFAIGMVSTLVFIRIREPQQQATDRPAHVRGDLRRVLRNNKAFVGLTISALVWNLALQVAVPFFNPYLVTAFNASALVIGVLAAISSLSALVGMRFWGRLLDRRSSYWVQTITGLIIPFAPLAWAFITASWQVAIINVFTGFLWAGFNMANFNLLLELTPDEQRPRAVALYQTVVFGSAVIGPLIGGLLVDSFGFQAVFASSAVGRAAAMLLFLVLVIRPRRRTASATP